MKKRRPKSDDIETIEWSRPMNLKQWCLIFGIDYKRKRNTLARWFRNQNIRNVQISPRYWRVHIKDLPAEYAHWACMKDFNQWLKNPDSDVGNALALQNLRRHGIDPSEVTPHMLQLEREYVLLRKMFEMKKKVGA